MPLFNFSKLSGKPNPRSANSPYPIPALSGVFGRSTLFTGCRAEQTDTVVNDRGKASLERGPLVYVQEKVDHRWVDR